MKLHALALATFLVGCGSSADETTSTPDAAATDSATADTSKSDTTTALDSAKEDAAGCPCLTSALAWEENGGRAAYYDHSALAGCSDYSQNRTSGGTMTTAMCTAQVERCATGPVDVAAINSALANADVKAAIAAAPILYGKDPRAFDGSVFQLKIDGKQIEIGDACGSDAGCKAPTTGILALRDLLRKLDEQQEAAACVALK